jgi:preprotein translocase subunit SecA
MIGTLKKIFGTKSEREVKSLSSKVQEIKEFAESITNMSEEDFRRRTNEIRRDLVETWKSAEDQLKKSGVNREEIKKRLYIIQEEKLQEYLPETFAMVKETCRRLVGQTWKVVGQDTKWEMIPYDVQLVGAIVLHQGKVEEMKTGEGKTLVATMPMFLNALTGRGVHLITVNDYLAQRDAEWMGAIFTKLGLTVGYILNTMDNQQRREAYNCDITYGTNNEFGFDYLRDNMSLSPEDQVQRSHEYAIVDEVDSVLIDEARTPLIISGAVDTPVNSAFSELRPLVQNLYRKQNSLVSNLVRQVEQLLKEGKDKEAGLKLLQSRRGSPKNRQLMKTFQEPGMIRLAHDIESMYMRDKKMHEVDEDLYFTVDEKSHVLDITENGRLVLSPDNPDTFVIPDLGEMLNDIESKEGLTLEEKARETEKAHQTHAERSGQIHNFNQLLRAYTMYEKDVEYVVQNGKVLIVDEFTGRILPGRRYSDGLHQAIEAKENVTIERETQTLATITIQNYFRLYEKLAGMTGTAETESEELGSIYNLDVTVIPTNQEVIRKDHEDLVYKTKREKLNAVVAEISDCYRRGQPVLVGTISVEVSELLSRMLKRQSIPHNVLNAKHHQKEAEIVIRAGQKSAVTIATNMAGRGTDIKLGEGVREIGGLHIIGTERHESRRIDLQLKGRSGRQGDPGSTRFYLSLEDDLMRLFSSDRIASIMDRMGVAEGEVITHSMVTRAISNAQKKVEGRNFGIRKHLLEYDDVMNQQRQVVYDMRKQAMHGSEMKETVLDFIFDYINEEIEKQEEDSIELWDWNALKQNISSHLLVSVDLDNLRNEVEKDGKKSIDDLSATDFSNIIFDKAKSVYATRESLIQEEVMHRFERFVVLRTIDEKWKDHLYAMDRVRDGINLRAYGQKDPLLEYKSEGFALFKDMMADLNSTVTQRLFRTQIQGMDQVSQTRRIIPKNVQVHHDDTTGMGFSRPPEGSRTEGKTPPNQPQQVARKPISVGKKIGRNDKIMIVSPNGEKIEIKYKKLQHYLNQGYTQLS